MLVHFETQQSVSATTLPPVASAEGRVMSHEPGMESAAAEYGQMDNKTKLLFHRRKSKK